MKSSESIKAYRFLWCGLIAGFLTACVQPVPKPVSAPTSTPRNLSSVPTEFPMEKYRQAKALGKKILEIDPARSLITIEVRRGGTLARLGHDHVVASHSVHGFIVSDDGQADLYLPLSELTVDEPNLMIDAGFDSHPSQEAIDGTRHNMLTKVLEEERFPFALIHLIRKDEAPLLMHTSISLHGKSLDVDVPVEIEKTRDGGMVVKGQLRFKQSDFGMTPLSALGGAMLVQDQLDLHFRIVAMNREIAE